jgi:glycosyltransferase involved in cell wall biosynthesis
MRVLHLVEATIAGVRSHVQALALGMTGQGYDISVACPPRRQRDYGEDEFVGELRQAGIDVITLPLQREIAAGPDARALSATVALLRRGSYDLVHTHSSKAGFVGRIAGALTGTPTVHTPNGLFFLGAASPLRRQFYLRLEQGLGLLARRLIAVSPGERALMLRYRLAPAGRIACIPNGVDLAALPRPLSRQSLGVPSGAPLIGTLARLEHQKNPQLFVRAAALLHKALPAAHFIWCGDGSLRAEAERLAAELGIAAQVHFLGYRRDGRAALAALDVFWLTSRFEGLPIALLEALALARPVVATEVVGSRDLIEHEANGLLTAPDDAAALARATLELLARPAYATRLAEAGRTLVNSRYTTGQMLAATAQLYHDVVSHLDAQEPANREVSLERQPRYVGDA